jgi:hypothetical protein
MFGSTRDYGLRPGSGSTPYTASGMFSSGYSGFMGGLSTMNPFGRKSNAYLYGATGRAGRFSWTSMIGYLASIITMILVILLMVHYFIRPVFQFNPGGPGFIPVPGMNDGQAYWPPGSVLNPIKTTETSIGLKNYNFSVALDILIKNPQTLGTTNRVFFSKGSNSPEPTTGKGKTLSDSILTVALLPTTTDMVVTLLNSDNNEEPLVISNVPVLTPFRLGIIVMDTVMEVYINGKLLKTRKLASSAKEGGEFFYPPQGQMASTVRINNLILWDKAITAPEMRYATPALMTVNNTDLVSMLPNGTVCGTDLGDSVDDMMTDINKKSGMASDAIADIGKQTGITGSN